MLKWGDLTEVTLMVSAYTLEMIFSFLSNREIAKIDLYKVLF